MAQLLRKIDDKLYVEYGTFGLADTDLTSWQSPEGYHFMADVRLESWDAEPAIPDTSWTLLKTESFVATSGVVHLASMMDNRGHDFLIGPPLFEYGVSIYFQLCEFGGGEDEEAGEEKWLLRFWPIGDAFDPLTHAVPFHYIVPEVVGHSIPLKPEQYTPVPADRDVPVPVSIAEDWVSMHLDPDRRTFDSWLMNLRERLGRKNISVYDWLRERGVAIEDGAELTPESTALPRQRPGRFRDPLIDRYYAEQQQTHRLDRRFRDLEEHELEERLREQSDAERIAAELTRGRARTFSMPVDGRGSHYLSPGISLRLWRWEDDILGGASPDRGLTVDRQILAKNPRTRQIFVSGIVTILRHDPDRSGYGDVTWYVVRDAEPHEAARVLCSEATWEEDPARRASLDALAREKLEALHAERNARRS
ncbi:hypothetical protein Aph01nite_67940 [Acrocarpospora phusangensis]|uniref:Uncharacterized protein n=1 Tax=Acrocarpospora phusangensis TaxID=1070424 RepID=A0A919QG31_9ACTN|nr:hypothetical protein [Acrocarpospora phusangensis]GIH28484.1 hypothetical protein Aph01nite_67940 [Acrocarpospora phusangensis]